MAGQIDLRVASPPANGSSSTSGWSGSTMTLTGTWILRSSGLRVPVSTIVHVRFGPTRKRPTSSSGFCVADSPMRCTSRPACSARRSSVIARCAPRLVCATAWISSTITCSAPSKISRACEVEHQVERLGRRDEDVRRVADHVAPLLLRRVARADAHLHRGADAAQRRAQVLLHVVGERLQRRDVDEPRAVGAGIGHQAVERPQERGERLARAGRGGDQRVLAGGDRRPCLRLGRGRLGEGAREPLRGPAG